MFAAASAGPAVAGHHVASGEPVAWRAGALALGLAFAGALPWVRGPRPLAAVLGGAVAVQLVLHHLLARSGTGGHTAHTAGQGGAPSAVVMLGAHTLAAVGVAVLLHRAERRSGALPQLLARIAATVRTAVARLSGAWPVQRRPGAARPRTRSRAGAGKRPYTVLAHVVVRRGPPGPGHVPLLPMTRPSPRRTMRKSRRTPAVRHTALALAAALGAVLAAAGPAAAHAGVTASDDRALAKNVTLTFTSEAESETAGIAKLQIVLPEGISPGAVSLKKGPQGWKFAQSQGGYTIAGKPLATGTDAVHSVTVKQLPDAKSLVFKIVETYGDGEVARWIELPEGGKKLDNPAPVLKLKAKSPGAKPEPLAPGPAASGPPAGTPAPGPSPVATPAPAPGAASGSPATVVEQVSQGDEGGLSTTLIVAVVVVVLAAGAGILWARKRRGGSVS
ncbi:DUF1775 domain-containing protein [Streptomyces sp. NPDC004609]|uniref:DUF1775 domain-containing protein n=1 Tax=Streptomyces sp. NPDC004609 TaxID=3364704 RepID=UPI00368A6916